MEKPLSFNVDRWTAARIRERVDVPTQPARFDLIEEDAKKEREHRIRCDLGSQNTRPTDPFAKRQRLI